MINLSLGYVAVYVVLIGIVSFIESPVGRGLGAFQLNALIRAGSLAAAAVVVLLAHAPARYGVNPEAGAGQNAPPSRAFVILAGYIVIIGVGGETVTTTTEQPAARPIPPPPVALLGCAR
ncbi:MAG TPA: hypothetical protein VIL98_00775 [Gaiellaceae bacterium]